MGDPQTASVRALAEPIVIEQDAELVEVSCHPHGGVLTVRLLVDRVGGVTIQDCARINQLIDRALEASGLIEASYTLEVSSPGLDRPLVSHRDYERAVGEDLRLVIRAENEGVRERVGQLLAVQPEAVVLKTSAGNLTIPLNEIQSAKKVIRL